MGLGASRKVKLVVVNEQTGVDGIEPETTEVKNLWAEINTISQSRGFADAKATYKTSYEFIFNYDSTIDLNVKTMIEYNNRFYSLQTIERVDKVRPDGAFAWQTRVNPEGRWWRVEAISEDYG